MPTLPNAKHEAFAYSIAKGMSQGDAYVHAGYKDSPPAASRLAKEPKVAARIEEIRAEMMSAAKAIADVPSEENALALQELGLTLDWCVEQFKDIAEKAKMAGQFAPANAAIKNIQSIIETKQAKDQDGRGEDEKKFSLKDITTLGSVFASIPDQPVLKDVTPTPDTGNKVDLTLLSEVVEDDNT